jgi:hypothetical protein
MQTLCEEIFTKSISEVDLIDVSMLGPDSLVNPQDNQRSFRGDCFEVFGEFFCAFFANDNRIGVREGKMVPLCEDLGVDLVGKSTVDGSPMSVQFKFKSDPGYIFQYRELATWLATSAFRYGVKSKDLVLVTTGMDVNHNIRAIAPDMIVVNRAIMRKMCDTNQGFWEDFHASIVNSLVQAKPRSQRTLYDYQQETIDTVSAILTA